MKHIILIVFTLVLTGCASVIRTPVPEEIHQDVTVLGHDDFRQWGDGRNPHLLRDAKEPGDLEKYYGGIMHTEHNYLVISGGGEKGAYGAGVLAGWTELGTRPEFVMVTGVSTGALTAPFAFLGSDYDDQLMQVYTTLDTRRIFNTRGMFAIIGGDSVVDTSPLSRLIEQFIDDEMIEALARESRRGRVLAVGTTNLDAGRPVVWNVTRIAASGHPNAAQLVRDVLLASASIPGAFPPVYIEVEGPDGKKYDEMHVDGGTTSQMFFYPPVVDWDALTEILDVKGTPRIHLIRNGFIRPEYKVMEPRLFPITNRTINSLIRTQGVGDFFRIYALAERDGLDMDVTWIPETANEEIDIEPSEAFDPNYMKALFEYGKQRMLDGEVWVDFSNLLEKVYIKDGTYRFD